jgi:hypothetical protein
MFTALRLVNALGVPLDMFTGSALRRALHVVGVLRVNRFEPIDSDRPVAAIGAGDDELNAARPAGFH